MKNATTWNGVPHTGGRSELPTHLDALAGQCSGVHHDVDFLAVALGYDTGSPPLTFHDPPGFPHCERDVEKARTLIFEMRQRIREIDALLVELEP